MRVFDLKNNGPATYDLAEAAFNEVGKELFNPTFLTSINETFKTEWEGIMPQVKLTSQEFNFAFKILTFKTFKTVFTEGVADDYALKVVAKFNSVF